MRPEQFKRTSLGLEAQAAGGHRVGVGFAQHNAVSQQFKEDIVVAAEDKAQRQGVVPALGAQQRVQLIQNHAGLDPDQQVQDPQRFVEEKLEWGGQEGEQALRTAEDAVSPPTFLQCDGENQYRRKTPPSSTPQRK